MLSLKMIQDHVDPLFGVGITNFLLGTGYLSKIPQTSFLINLFENLDADR